jgi:hypothetical protein
VCEDEDSGVAGSRVHFGLAQASRSIGEIREIVDDGLQDDAEVAREHLSVSVGGHDERGPSLSSDGVAEAEGSPLATVDGGHGHEGSGSSSKGGSPVVIAVDDDEGLGGSTAEDFWERSDHRGDVVALFVGSDHDGYLRKGGTGVGEVEVGLGQLIDECIDLSGASLRSVVHVATDRGASTVSMLRLMTFSIPLQPRWLPRRDAPREG